MTNNTPKEGSFGECLREIEQFFTLKWQIGEYVQPGECTHVKDKDSPRCEHFATRIVDRPEGMCEVWPDLTEHEYDSRELHMSSGKSRGRIRIQLDTHYLPHFEGYDY